MHAWRCPVYYINNCLILFEKSKNDMVYNKSPDLDHSSSVISLGLTGKCGIYIYLVLTCGLCVPVLTIWFTKNEKKSSTSIERWKVSDRSHVAKIGLTHHFYHIYTFDILFFVHNRIRDDHATTSLCMVDTYNIILFTCTHLVCYLPHSR